MSPVASGKTRAWVELNTENLRHNVAYLRGLLPEGCELMPAVKANAYGHGVVPISRELNAVGVDAFCVATIDEGIELRLAGVRGLVLILGYTHPSRFELLQKYDLTQTIVDTDYARALSLCPGRTKAHLAVDTGMHRLGADYSDTESILDIFGMDNLDVGGVYTHLCTVEGGSPEDIAYTDLQAERFKSLVSVLNAAGYFPKTHILSSYGLLARPELGGDYARIGIALYGVLSDGNDSERFLHDLRPVLSLKARLSSVRTLKKGESAGYDLKFTAERDCVIAALAIGYADGLPRSLSCGNGSVLIRGVRCPIVGRICMDQALADVSAVEGVCAGDEAVFIGSDGDETLSACDMAKSCGTITNEILSRLGQRLPRVVI